MCHHDAVRFYFYFEIELRYTMENAVCFFCFCTLCTVKYTSICSSCIKFNLHTADLNELIIQFPIHHTNNVVNM